MRRSLKISRFLGIATGLVLAGSAFGSPAAAEDGARGVPVLLTDPFLQLPTRDGVHVVWFTEFRGHGHHVMVGAGSPRRVEASSHPMSRLAEDGLSHVGAQSGDGSLHERWTPRPIFRHEAHVDGLTPGEREPYFVSSSTGSGDTIESGTFTLAPLPQAGQPLRILLTSDHQLMPLTPANLQKVEETIGRVDAVLMAGDLQNVPDRASEWFDDNRGGAFFPALQGRADRPVSDAPGAKRYRGGALIQHAPLFPVIGNHEVMGRFEPELGLTGMFNDPRPRAAALELHRTLAPAQGPVADRDPEDRWIRDQSFNTITYEEMFTLPTDGPAGERYYALGFGDVFIVGLYGARIWRSPDMDAQTKGRYREAQDDLSEPARWGWGEFIFEDMARGSPQHTWLQEVLKRRSFREAPFKIVMLHQPSHGLGDNSVPAFAHPVQEIERDGAGRIAAVRYSYPLEEDIFVRDVEPLLAEAGVDLVLNGHSHLWARFTGPTGLHFLETSNVGNTYGCFVEGHLRREGVPDGSDYPPTGDPHGYEPVMPSLFAPMTGRDGSDLPCVASDRMTVFSVLDTAAARVESYAYDLGTGDVRLFDSFALDR